MPSKINYGLKKLSTLLVEGGGMLSEYWIIGLIHEIGRHTVYYNGNVNHPKVGYFATAIFVIFYLGRTLGNLFGLTFSKNRRYVRYTWLLYIPMIIFTYIQGMYTGALWIIGCRAILGFTSGMAPATCMLRDQTNKEEVLEKIKEGKDTKPSSVNFWLEAFVEFFCSYLCIFLGAWLYDHGAQDIAKPTLVFTVLVALMFIMFAIFYNCTEPKNLSNNKQVSAVVNKLTKTNQYQGKLPGIFDFFLEDEDLMLDTIAVKIIEAVRVFDLVFIVIMAQCNPYFKGLWIDRIPLCLTIAAAAFVSVILGGILVKFVDENDTLFWMQIVQIGSMIIYPLSVTVVNYMGYEQPDKAMYIFGAFEVLKFTGVYVLRDQLKEIIEKTNPHKEESFKALANFTEDLIKFLMFGLFGYVVTRFMSSMRIQKMNPWNYTISFGVLIIPLFAAWFLISLAAAMKKKQKQQKIDW